MTLTKKDKVSDQHIFILNWMIENQDVSCQDSDFHDAFHDKFGGSRKPVNYGASMVFKAMTRIKELHREGRIVRGRVSMAGAGIGFPTWVWVYQFNEHQEQSALRDVREASANE